MAVDNRSAEAKPVNKWEILRELSQARKAFGVSDRDLSVLQALLSFHPRDLLDTTCSMIVFPSNARICERLNGMPCSTMRRHLANLVSAGLLIRRDSPNGKRYRRKTIAGEIAYGFDLSPLHNYAPQICETAQSLREEADALATLRETVTLLRRDLLALCTLGESSSPALPLWDSLRTAYTACVAQLHRRSSKELLETVKSALTDLVRTATAHISQTETPKMSTSACQNEQHYQTSNKEYLDIESTKANSADQPATVDIAIEKMKQEPDHTHLPLHSVLEPCKSLATFYPHPIRSWHQLIDAANHIRPAMGISPAVWEEAKQAMGASTAAAVLAAMLERFQQIKSPSAYLRFLAKKTAIGQFSCAKMLLALTPKVS